MSSEITISINMVQHSGKRKSILVSISETATVVAGMSIFTLVFDVCNHKLRKREDWTVKGLFLSRLIDHIMTKYIIVI
jgi:hypothetical protein